MKIRGWRLVPVEATEGMTETGSRAGRAPIHPAAWSAMLAAAPDPLQDERLLELVERELHWNMHLGPQGQARAVLALFRGEKS